MLLAACTVGPNYKRPLFELPAAWRKDAAPVEAAVQAPDKWWTVFGDPNLDTLVAEALERNRDLAAAAARIDQARANLTIVNADRYPAVSAQYDPNRTRYSTVGVTPFPPGFPNTLNDYRVTLGASYEIDFWGKYRRASEAARAELLGSQAGRDAVRLSLTSDVVKSYYNLLSLRGQAEVAQRTLGTREELVGLQTKRFHSGVLSELEVRQVEADRDAAQVQVTALKNQRESEDARLAVLLGRSPRDVWEKRIEEALSAPPLAGPGPVTVPEGLPSDLLQRRPDLRQAEQQLIAANARIGVAKANYFPSISLTGYLGSESTALSTLFSGPARIFPDRRRDHPADLERRPRRRPGRPGHRAAKGSPGQLRKVGAKRLRRRARRPLRAGRRARNRRHPGAPRRHPGPGPEAGAFALQQRHFQPARRARLRAQFAGRRAVAHPGTGSATRRRGRPNQGIGRRLGSGLTDLRASAAPWPGTPDTPRQTTPPAPAPRARSGND